jgi:cob(I)alamin adenosyltransferase
VVGADLATPGQAAKIPRVSDSDVTVLEHAIDQFEAMLPPLTRFLCLVAIWRQLTSI